LVGLTGGRSFETGEIEAVEDEAGEPTPAEVERARAAFRRLVEIAEAEVEDIPEQSPQLSFEMSAHVDFGADLKQELLELRSEQARLRRLAEILERAVEAMKLEREVRE